jgi:hypothetical protein
VNSLGMTPAIAEHDQILTAWLPVLLRERSTDSSARSEHNEEVRRELPADDPFRVFGARDRVRAIPEGTDRVEKICPVPPDAVVVHRAFRVLSSLGVPRRDPHELVGVVVRKRAEQHVLDDTEDRDVGSQPEPDREHGGCREPRRAGDETEGGPHDANKLAHV